MYSFTGFTKKANNAINYAILAAQNMGHTYIGTEHLALGLIKEEDGVAGAVLKQLNINYEDYAALVSETNGEGEIIALTPNDFTPRTKRVLQSALINARLIGQKFVGTEHILLAIADESDSYAMRFFEQLGVKPEDIINSVGSEMSVPDSKGMTDMGESQKSGNPKTKTDYLGRGKEPCTIKSRQI